MKFTPFKEIVPQFEFKGLTIINEGDVWQSLVDVKYTKYLMGKSDFCKEHQAKMFQIVKSLAIKESNRKNISSIVRLTEFDDDIINHFSGENGCENIISRTIKYNKTYEFNKNIYEQIEYIQKLQNA